MEGKIQLLGKMILAIGLIIVIAGLMFPGVDSGWNNFQTTLQNITWPTYNNPFAPQTAIAQLIPQDSFCFYDNPNAICNGNTTLPNNLVGCTFGTAIQCINTDDEDTSYAVINGTGGQFGFEFNGTQAGFENYSIQSVNVGVWCRSGNQSVSFLIHFSSTSLALNFYGTCPVSNGPYVKVNGAFPFEIVSSPFGSNYTVFVDRNGTQAGGFARVTFVDLEVSYIPAQVTCTGNVFENTGCQLASIGRTFVKIVAAIINGIVFAISIVAWVGYVMAIFFLAMIQTLLFLYTLPGVPIQIQALVSVIVTALLGGIIFILLSFLRGNE